MIDIVGAIMGRKSASDGWIPGADYGFNPSSNFWFTTLGGGKTESGVNVNEDIAFTYSAVWCATLRRAGTLATLPKNVYRRINSRRSELAREHAAYRLIKRRPNPYMRASAFWALMEERRLNGGNAVAEIQWDRESDDPDRVPLALWPIHPTRVKLVFADGVPWYELKTSDGEKYLPHTDVLHLQSLISKDGMWGHGVIQVARESIGFGIATERHGAKTFGSGAMPKVIVTHPRAMTPEQRLNFRKEWKEIHTDGGFDVAILSEGADAKPLTLSVKDQQFLETRQHNIEEMARWYDLPPHTLRQLLQATFSNIEHQGIEMVTYSFNPWVEAAEEEILAKLFPSEADQETYYVKYEMNGLLRGDTAARAAFYHAGITDAWLKPDEARELEDLDYEGDADQLFIQGAMVPLKNINDPPDPAVAAIPAGAADPDEADDGESQDARESVLKIAAGELLAESLCRMIRKEATAARRAAKKPDGFLAWLDEFYGDHADQLSEALTRPLRVCSAFGVSNEPATMSQQLCRESRERLLELSGTASAAELPTVIDALMCDWERDRAAAVVRGIAELN